MSKKVEIYVVYNWKEDEPKIRKTEPSSTDVGPYDIVTKINLNLDLPDRNMPEITANLNIPESQVQKAVGEHFEVEETQPEEGSGE